MSTDKETKPKSPVFHIATMGVGALALIALVIAGTSEPTGDVVSSGWETDEVAEIEPGTPDESVVDAYVELSGDAVSPEDVDPLTTPVAADGDAADMATEGEIDSVENTTNAGSDMEDDA